MSIRFIKSASFNKWPWVYVASPGKVYYLFWLRFGIEVTL